MPKTFLARKLLAGTARQIGAQPSRTSDLVILGEGSPEVNSSRPKAAVKREAGRDRAEQSEQARIEPRRESARKRTCMAGANGAPKRYTASSAQGYAVLSLCDYAQHLKSRRPSLWPAELPCKHLQEAALLFLSTIDP